MGTRHVAMGALVLASLLIDSHFVFAQGRMGGGRSFGNRSSQGPGLRSRGNSNNNNYNNNSNDSSNRYNAPTTEKELPSSPAVDSQRSVASKSGADSKQLADSNQSSQSIDTKDFALKSASPKPAMNPALVLEKTLRDKDRDKLAATRGIPARDAQSKNGATRSGAPVDKTPQRWAVLIGVDEYVYVRGLKYCVADQKALAQQLLAAGYPQDQVFLMVDSASEQKNRPFKSNVETQLKLVFDMAEEGDIILLGFSGHGVHIGGHSYLCPTDAKLDDPQGTMVALDKVYEQLDASKATLKLLVIDACRNDPRLGNERSLDPNESLRGLSASLEKPPKGISLLSSCAPGQTAREDPQLGHGVFMHFILQALQGKAADDEGTVSLMRLADFTSIETKKYVADKFRATQTPYFRGEINGPVELAHLVRDTPAKSGSTHKPTTVKAGETITNSIGMKLTQIPAGEFSMGCGETVSEAIRDFPELKVTQIDDERPQHKVRITKPFYLGSYEVTLGQFRTFVNDARYTAEAIRSGQGGEGYDPAANSKDGWIYRSKKFVPSNWGFKDQTDNHPVVNVTWNDAVAFCDWLSKKEGKKYRLPTEAEWEYAARAGSNSRFAFGADPEALANCDNVADGSLKTLFTKWSTINARDGFTFTAPVGCFKPNDFGLCDMHGNVSEWCSDLYAANEYENSVTDDPQGPDADEGQQGTLVQRVHRGGDWRHRIEYCRCSYRRYDEPSYCACDLGFRVVRETP